MRLQRKRGWKNIWLGHDAEHDLKKNCETEAQRLQENWGFFLQVSLH